MKTINLLFPLPVTYTFAGNNRDAYASQVLTPLMELEIQVENKGVAVTH